MTGQLDIIREGHMGRIALNRPEAINALSREMIDGISRTLVQWRDDDAIRLVLFEGRGTRGFCSGGDVRAVRQLVLSGDGAAADAYFAAEYRMNALIARYRKPLVVLSHGVVMGGGIGIAGHCRYRFTTREAKFAMPEAAIGFVCDVGVDAIMAEAPLSRALAFLMSGTAVGAADALELGLADVVIDPARFDAVRNGISAAAGRPDIVAALRAVMDLERVDAGVAAFSAQADRLSDLAFADAAQIVAAVAARAEADPEYAELATRLAARSPTSLEAIVQSHLAARQAGSIEAVLGIDLRLAMLMARHPDFAEGVRAVLIDKDHRPQWHTKDFVNVPSAAIRQAIVANSPTIGSLP